MYRTCLPYLARNIDVDPFVDHEPLGADLIVAHRFAESSEAEARGTPQNTLNRKIGVEMPFLDWKSEGRLVRCTVRRWMAS